MRIYAFQKLPGCNNAKYLEHWLNGVFHKGRDSGTYCYHYELPDDEAAAWVAAGIARVIPKGRKFPCVKHAAGESTGKKVY